MAFSRPHLAPKCEFCGAPLEDLMLAFVEHIERSPECRVLYEEWRQNVRRESGGT